MLEIVIWATVAYLFGSISTAVITCKLMGLQDPRTVGSNNPGATNVLRTGGKKAAIITLAGDIIKGVIPVVAAKLLSSGEVVVACTGLAAFIGHLFPVFFGFKGGKGVATAAGVMLAWQWLAGLEILGIWIAMAAIFRYSSLSALTASLAAPILMWLNTHSASLTYTSIGIAALLIFRHQANIRRLLRGEEGKIGEKKAQTEAPQS